MFVTSRNTTYLPNLYGTYGSAFHSRIGLCKETACSLMFELERILWNRKSSDDYRCDEDNSQINTEYCLDTFIEAKVGCSTKHQGVARSLPPCTTLDQFLMWAKWTDNVTKLDETSIYELTGCLGPCKLNDYKLTAMADLMTINTPGVTKGALALRFAFMIGKHEVREQYYTYDRDSFIADVGGYLGLLLGHSIYSIACSLEGAGGFLKKQFLKL